MSAVLVSSPATFICCGLNLNHISFGNQAYDGSVEYGCSNSRLKIISIVVVLGYEAVVLGAYI
jgi:hypothetical protein